MIYDLANQFELDMFYHAIDRANLKFKTSFKKKNSFSLLDGNVNFRGIPINCFTVTININLRYNLSFTGGYCVSINVEGINIVIQPWSCENNQ